MKSYDKNGYRQLTEAEQTDESKIDVDEELVLVSAGSIETGGQCTTMVQKKKGE